MKRHNERCKECKSTIQLLLQRIYGRVELNYDLGVGTLPEDYQKFPFSDFLGSIYKSLQSHRGYDVFIRTKRLPRVDYFIPQPGFIVEFDESQHFTACRKIALLGYPQELRLGFDREKWINQCETINAKDFNPPFRDEQRAWYDTLRDFLPSAKSLLPTVRLYSRSIQWCGLNPKNPADLGRFKLILEDTWAT